MFDSFFRVGSLVFGGGHVVLPLLQAEVVPPGWVTNEEFVAGYGAAQAVPGPLFHACRVSRRRDATTAERHRGRGHRPRRHLPAHVPHGRGALLLPECPPSARRFPGGAPGHQCRSRRVAPCRALSPGLDQRDQDVGRPGVSPSSRFALLALWNFPAWLVVVIAALGGAVLRSAMRRKGCSSSPSDSREIQMRKNFGAVIVAVGLVFAHGIWLARHVPVALRRRRGRGDRKTQG